MRCHSRLIPESDHRWEESLASIDGAVFFRERIALPRNAELEVQLLDLSNPSKPVTLLSSGAIRPVGSPPYDFSIPVKMTKLDMDMLKNRSYGLRATIHADGQLMFANEDFVDPASGTPKHILVHRMPRQAEEYAAEPLEGPRIPRFASPEQPPAQPHSEHPPSSPCSGNDH